MSYPPIHAALARERQNTLLAEAHAARRTSRAARRCRLPSPVAPPAQPRAKITVTVTLSCWVPGWTGTEEAARAGLAVANSGTG
jgi:hypothetical protein